MLSTSLYAMGMLSRLEGVEIDPGAATEDSNIISTVIVLLWRLLERAFGSVRSTSHGAIIIVRMMLSLPLLSRWPPAFVTYIRRNEERVKDPHGSFTRSLAALV